MLEWLTDCVDDAREWGEEAWEVFREQPGWALLLLPGLIVFCGGLSLSFHEMRARAFTQVEGSVESSLVSEGQSYRTNSLGTTYFTVYCPEISYRYATTDGAEHTGDQIRPAGNGCFQDEEEAQQVIDSLIEDGAVTVWVDDNEPTRAFLMVEGEYTGPASALLGLLMTLFCGWLLLKN